MNKYLTFLLVFFTGLAGAQEPITLHVVYQVLDQRQDRIFEGCQRDLAGGEEFFTALQEITQEFGDELLVVQHRLDFTHAGVERFFEEFTYQPQDALLFIYSGHGLAADQADVWPMTSYCLEGDPLITTAPEKCAFPLESIHHRLRETDLRMSVIVISSCNWDGEGNHDNTRAREQFGHRAPMGGTGTGISHQSLDLFTKYRGHILATASGPGQVAYLNNGIGSYYLASFYHALLDGFAAEQPSSWASIFRQTDRRVKQYWQKNQDAQFQIHKNNRTMASDPDHVPEAVAIDETEFSQDWEDQEFLDESLEMVAFLLLDQLDRSGNVSDEEFDGVLEELLTLYDEVILKPYHGFYTETLAAELFEEAAYALDETDEDLTDLSAVYLEALDPELQSIIQEILDLL